MTTYELHSLCRIFPAMSERELIDLADDIEKNGQKEPIHTWEGLVLDGRNRLNACLLVGCEPWIEALDGSIRHKSLARWHL